MSKNKLDNPAFYWEESPMYDLLLEAIADYLKNNKKESLEIITDRDITIIHAFIEFYEYDPADAEQIMEDVFNNKFDEDDENGDEEDNLH